MTKQFVWWLCLGLIGILVVATSAPALPTAVSVVDDDQTIEPSELDDEEEQLVEEHVGEQPESGEGGSLPAEWLLLGVGILGLVTSVRIGLANPTKSTVLLALGIAGVAAVLGWLALGGWAVETGSTDVIPDGVSLVVVVLLLILAISGTAIVLARSTTETPSLDATAGPVQDRQDSLTTDTSPVAGLTSTTNRPADNDIYRTWQALAESVGKGDDDTATPDDVQAAAIDHGFDTEPVDDLRRLFEDSRYGNQKPTPKREQRARGLHHDLKPTEADSDE